MPLPLRPHRDTAPDVDTREAVYEVVAAQADGNPHLEFFPPEEPHGESPKERQSHRQRESHEDPVFVIEPASHTAPRWAQDQLLHREPVPSDAELLQAFVRTIVPRPGFLRVLDPRTILAVVLRSVVATLSSMRRLAVGALFDSRFLSLGGAATTRVRAGLTGKMGHVTLVAFGGGTALGALIMWLAGVPPATSAPTDSGVTLASSVAVPGPQPAQDRGATVYTATPASMSLSRELHPIDEPQEGTTPSSEPTPPAVPKPSAAPTPSTVPTASIGPPPPVVASPAITVTSTPAGARVTVDGIGWGQTPVTIHHLPPGQKVIRVSMEGYQSEQRIISVPGEPQSAAVRVALRARK